MLTRRCFAAFGAMAALSACARPIAPEAAPPAYPPLPMFYGPIYGEPFPIPAIEEGSLAPELWRQEVQNPWPNSPRGSIIIDPGAKLLHFVEGRETAIRYGVSVGAQGFSWDGTARLQFGREWPRWKVPDDMIKRRPELAPYSVANGGMDAGPGNPLGARALYLFQNGKDTLYRIHGDASAQELGHAVSSGCIRMLNQDAIDLYDRHVHGAAVTVLPSVRSVGLSDVY
ncbi:L,D-transpeptidase [Pseudorhodobacter aquimaris]|uniref:L,D-transpeptidase n=1 Tax=Pseudorhodobacter aquimaris TaxID=687412 RepID=UPI00067DFEAD|nr:L,D-transpeptidase [Pseudorhodobacter aquimaris]